MADDLKAKMKAFDEEVETMDELEIGRENLYTLKRLSQKLDVMDEDIVRIKKNVLFFFWMFMLSIGFWIIAILFWSALGLAALA